MLKPKKSQEKSKGRRPPLSFLQNGGPSVPPRGCPRKTTEVLPGRHLCTPVSSWVFSPPTKGTSYDCLKRFPFVGTDLHKNTRLGKLAVVFQIPAYPSNMTSELSLSHVLVPQASVQALGRVNNFQLSRLYHNQLQLLGGKTRFYSNLIYQVKSLRS